MTKYIATITQATTQKTVGIASGQNLIALQVKAQAEASKRNDAEANATQWAPSVIPVMGTRNRVGSTVNVEKGFYTGGLGGSLELNDARSFDSLVGLAMAQRSQNLYYQPGQLPSPSPNLLNFVAQGGLPLISFKPSVAFDQDATFVACLQAHMAALGTAWMATIWQEPNTGKSQSAGITSSDFYQSYIAHYGPLFRQYCPGVPLVYKPALCGPADECNEASVEAFCPPQGLVDGIGPDYYCTAWKAGTLLDGIGALAQSYGVPLGLYEWSIAASKRAVNMTDFQNYGQYLIDFYSGWLDAGYSTSVINYWGSDGEGAFPGVDTIQTATDPKIEVVRAVALTLGA